MSKIDAELVNEILYNYAENKSEEYKKTHYAELLAQHQEANIELLQQSRLYQWMFYAIDQNKLIYIGVTSEAEGSKTAIGIAYGMGKSTVMLQIIALGMMIYLENRKNILIYTKKDHDFIWELIFNAGLLWLRMKAMYEYYWVKPKEYSFIQPQYLPNPELLKMIQLPDECVPINGGDDLQLSVSTVYSHDPQLRQVGDALSTARHGQWKVMIGTFPKATDLMKDFRMAFSAFDLIVYDEGFYELQKVQYKHSDFYNWLKIIPKARYQSEGTFPALPPHIQKRYDAWYKRESRILHRNRFRAWQKPKTPDDMLNLDNPEQQTKRKLLKDARASKERADRTERYLRVLLDENANTGQRLNAIRHAKNHLNIT